MNKPRRNVYMVRDVPPETWRKFKSRAAQEGRLLKGLFLRWIQRYAEGK